MKKLIPLIALVTAVMSGGAFSAHALPAGALDEPAVKAAPNPDYAAAMENYRRLLADYRKDMAAYEADPGTWTADLPRMPAKPDVTVAVARQQEPSQHIERKQQ